MRKQHSNKNFRTALRYSIPDGYDVLMDNRGQRSSFVGDVCPQLTTGLGQLVSSSPPDHIPTGSTTIFEDRALAYKVRIVV